MTTGCQKCDKKQAETGDKGAMCPACEIGMCEQTISSAMNRIEELKKIIEREKQCQTS
jgi:hypothetical protein